MAFSWSPTTATARPHATPWYAGRPSTVPAYADRLPLTEQQLKGIELLVAWFRNPRRRPFFLIFGYAGTGKTTIIKLAIEALGLAPRAVRFAAYTGKAAAIMAAAGCLNASTLHSLLYLVSGESDDHQPEFDLNLHDPRLRSVKLIVIDEMSTIDDDMAHDILQLQIPVIVLGDPFQLPPIRGTAYFAAQQPDVMLTAVHRQAKDNPILRASMALREDYHTRIGDFADGERLIAHRRSSMPLEQMLATDQVIAGFHRTRRAINAQAVQHAHLDSDGVPTIAGGKIVVTRNHRHYGVLNGVTYRIGTAPLRAGRAFTTTIVADDGRRVRCPIHVAAFESYRTFNEAGALSPADRADIALRRPVLADWGYCITLHKSQGSQYRSIALIDDGFGRSAEERARARYTGLTRASETAHYIQ